MLSAAKIGLKEAKKALNALIKLLFCLDNCSICTKHNMITDGVRLVRGDGLRGNNCVCNVPPPVSAEALSSETTVLSPFYAY